MRHLVRPSVVLLALAWACIAGGCSSSSSSGGTGGGTGASSISGYIHFTPQFTNLENKMNDAGIEAYKVEVKMFDQHLTCGNYDPPSGAYSIVKIKVENMSHTGVIGPGTYNVTDPNMDNYVMFYRVDANGNEVAGADATQGTITLTSVHAGSSASGHFSAELAQNTADDAGGSGMLSGTFSASVCP